MNVPIIKLEVTGMSHTIQTALAKHHLDVEQYVQEALEKYCQEDNLRSVVSQAAQQALDAAVKSCIADFYRSGDGRKAVRKEVEERLRNWGEF